MTSPDPTTVNPTSADPGNDREWEPVGDNVTVTGSVDGDRQVIAPMGGGRREQACLGSVKFYIQEIGGDPAWIFAGNRGIVPRRVTAPGCCFLMIFYTSKFSQTPVFLGLKIKIRHLPIFSPL